MSTGRKVLLSLLELTIWTDLTQILLFSCACKSLECIYVHIYRISLAQYYLGAHAH